MATRLGKNCSLVNCACLSLTFINFCVSSSFRFGFEGGIRDVIVLIPDHCLSFYFTTWNCHLSAPCFKMFSFQDGLLATCFIEGCME